MNNRKLSKSPHLSLIIYQIEKTIHKIDATLVGAGVLLTDTNVKSSLRKAMGHAKGKKPSFPESNEKDEGMKQIAAALIELGDRLTGDEGAPQQVTKKDWLLALKATEDSLKTRKEMHGHSRGYLDFLKGFIGEGKL